jgi:hypothetical protein
MDQVNELLKLLSEAPEGQIDKRVCQNLKDLIGKPVPEIKTGVMKAIDDCVNGGLASELGMLVLNDLFYVQLDGKREDFNDVNCPWRK